MINKRLISLFMLLWMLVTTCLAAENNLISPALIHFSKNIELKKSSVSGCDVQFSPEDFDEVFCTTVQFIKIEQLPDSHKGALYLAGVKPGCNQIIERDKLDMLVFRPATAEVTEASFRVSNASPGETELEAGCHVYLSETQNMSPYAEAMSLSTYESVPAFGFLAATDPEGDELTFEVLSYPGHGAVRIAEGSGGYFSYTPVKGYTGKDSFSYIAYDKYGNASARASVTVKVCENRDGVSFEDLSGHWAHSPAISCFSMGLMKGSENGNGGFDFRPGDTVTRGDFLAMALICAGKEKDISFVTQTSFADDADIPMNIKSYAEYARQKGIVKGYGDDAQSAVFDSSSAITRAQAAVILDRILCLQTAKNETAVFADGGSLQHHEADSLSRLAECGIIKGTGFGELLPEEFVTRAQAAQLLYNVKDYVGE